MSNEGMPRRVFLGALAAISASAQQTPSPAEAAVEFVCPMDPDVRSAVPGRCPRCGMKLVPGIPDPVEYRVAVELRPSPPRPGQKLQLVFRVYDPRKETPVTHFQLVHEKLFHMFAVSQDLEFFLHNHPRFGPDGAFRFETVLPKPGLYRILSDFYPQGGTPQLIASTVIVPGGPITPGADLKPHLAPAHAANMEVSLSLEPQQPIAGLKTLLFFHLNPADGLEQYLGAWGHMLAVSNDMVDMIHNHPFLADGSARVQFNLIFPRPGVYRMWVQFQRKGVVNTARFDVPVKELD